MAEGKADSSVNFLPQGAIIQEFIVGGTNIVQSFPEPSQYLDAPFFGETIGRYPNRIKNGVIDNLNGKSYKLAVNNPPNHLHGGPNGWGKKTFLGPVPTEKEGRTGVYFTYTSPDGDEGYPGTLDVSVWYVAYQASEDGKSKTVLEVDYEVAFTGDECDETAVAVTNHSYFNVSGGPTIEGTEITLSTNKHQVIDEHQIPTGQIEPYPGVEANVPFTLGKTAPAIDHCFVLDTKPQEVPVDTREQPLQKIVSFYHPVSNIHLDISTTEPAFQFYTGEHVDIPAKEGSPGKPARCGICVEPSRYINAINVPEWRGMVLLKRGQTWGAKSVYKAWKD